MANAAYMGFYTPPDSKPIKYEIRIYPDHMSAVEKGTEYAEEVTGEDALLRSVDVIWGRRVLTIPEEGVRRGIFDSTLW
ncbi:MAG: hypothetical protein CM1200mP39_19770 [Dehalococcoidia bacterium]|nr:MAG: hypothetical protein CM1200mP39_19770 [Dehalococcoidia bacterium]